MGSLPAEFSADAVASIRARLEAVRAEGPRVLFAIESGSRAWGFPSPDSDYDCRFIYVRPPRQHLALEQPRDVIEFPIEGDVDTGGWDLRKALLLALSGNAVVVEWANSPMVYEEIEGFRPRLLSLLEEIVDPTRVAQHYLGLARSHVSRIGGFDGEVKLKRLFYLLRPLIELDWMEQRRFAKLPPMNMLECLDQSEVEPIAADDIRSLVGLKAETREMGVGKMPPVIARYVEARYSYHAANMPNVTRDESRRRRDRALAEAFYREEAERT
jgi:predicted nucleotidyltransferase